jgi:two-component system, OmpR family, KDP operon response regulator KdpE
MAVIVIVEDDRVARDGWARALNASGHVVHTADTAMTGLDLAVTKRPNVVILDLGLPDLDGVMMLRMLRTTSDVPVIVATARADETEIVRTLDSGADDYLCKPFSPDQLEARIRAVLRRFNNDPSDELAVGGLRLNPRSREVTCDGISIALSRKEFELLHYLMARRGDVVSKQELLAEVWRQPFFSTPKTVDVHLSWLRRKLGESADQPRYIHVVRGVGVKLEADH